MYDEARKREAELWNVAVRMARNWPGGPRLRWDCRRREAYLGVPVGEIMAVGRNQ